MANQYEVIPPAHPNRQFPGGEPDELGLERGRELLAELTSGDPDEHMGRIVMMRKMEVPSWRALPGQKAEFGDLVYLCDAWGNTSRNREAGSAMAQIGLMSMLAFVKKSRMLPMNYPNYQEEIMIMSTYSADDVKFFADGAWSLMHQTHPKTYNVLAPFVRHLAEVNHVQYVDEMLVLLDAGSALPYLMSATARQEGYLSRAIDSYNKDGSGLSGLMSGS